MFPIGSAIVLLQMNYSVLSSHPPLTKKGREGFVLRIKFLLLQEFFRGHEIGLSLALHPLIIPSHKDRAHRTGLFTETTEDTPCGIQFVGEGIPSPLLILSRLDIDALRRTDGHTEATGYTFGFSAFILLKILNPSPPFGWRDLFLRILDGDGFGKEIS